MYNGGTELNSDFDIDVYETPNRGYDAQLGRFWQQDGLADSYSGITPYQFGFNNPVSFNDPSGLDPGDPFFDYWNNWLVNNGFSQNTNGTWHKNTSNGDELEPVTVSSSHHANNTTPTGDPWSWITFGEGSYRLGIKESNYEQQRNAQKQAEELRRKALLQFAELNKNSLKSLKSFFDILKKHFVISTSINVSAGAQVGMGSKHEGDFKLNLISKELYSYDMGIRNGKYYTEEKFPENLNLSSSASISMLVGGEADVTHNSKKWNTATFNVGIGPITYEYSTDNGGSNTKHFIGLDWSQHVETIIGINADFRIGFEF